MRLLHYPNDPNFEFEPSKTYPVSDSDTPFKPIGFWVSVEGEDDWKEWCSSENFNVERLDFEHEVTLVDTHNILIISTLDELGVFHLKYSRTLEGSASKGFSWAFIDWPELVKNYDGINETCCERNDCPDIPREKINWEQLKKK